MKTTDLIPLILLELKNCDKYGFELTKSIETKSNGKIVIKQPTLYTILKKLEKSKFISSYWQDSDIGGKRHYYKITENGLKQASTLPSYEELLSVACEETSPVAEDEEKPANAQPTENLNNFSIFDHLGSAPQEEIETVLPSEEVFKYTSIDDATELELNQQNLNVVKAEENNKEEVFASSTEVKKFIEVENVSTEIPAQVIDEKQTKTTSLKDFDSSAYSLNLTEINYVDYVDLKKDENYIYSKKMSRSLTKRTIFSCTYLLAMLILCSVIAGFTAKTPIFYISIILSIACLIFIPTIYAYRYKNVKQKLLKNKLNINFKRILILYIIIEIIVILFCIVISILMGNNSILNVFSINNFGNIYAPILLTSTLFVDLLFVKILTKN